MYRQQQQILEIENFAAGGDRVAQHPDPQLYGSGWGDPEQVRHLSDILETLNLALSEQPAGSENYVVEIGCGGGRWTRQIAMFRQRHSYQFRLLAIDGTGAAFKLTSQALSNCGASAPIQYQLCPDGRFELDRPANVIVSFDVFVHFDNALIESYLDSVAAALRPGGKFLCSFASAFGSDEPDWIRSDEWFNYVMDRHTFHGWLAERLDRDFTWSTPYLHASGYGQAYVEFTRR